MDNETLIAFIGLVVLFLTHLVVFTIYITKLSSRIVHCERDTESLFKADISLTEEMKTLSKIEAQIELLITHFMPKT